jgi:cytosine/uracil/thiamine/allantoin permease
MENLILVIVGLIINGIIANLIGNLGNEKKIGYKTSFCVSFLLSPIIGLLMVIASVPLLEGEKIKPINIDREKLGKNVINVISLIVIAIVMAILCSTH